jgi:hypothetical protein
VKALSTAVAFPVAVSRMWRPDLEVDPIADLLSRQEGVLARRQVEAAGLQRHDIARLLRRREWVRTLPGIYVDHTGEPTWSQRAWMGVLVAEPAALAGTAALRAVTGPGPRYDETVPIEIAVDVARHLPQHSGFNLARMAHLSERVQWTASPPRVRFEHAALDVAQRATNHFALVAHLADVCQSRCTTADRLLQVLEVRPRMSRRRFLGDVLTDIANGTCSVLEHGYLTKIERPHGLPTGSRQPSERHEGTVVYRDDDYAAYRRLVELDGTLFHNSATQRDRDLDRDLDAACEDRLTVRLGWGQVYGRPCRTTVRIARFLRGGGWSGVPTPCGPGCPV